MASFVHDELLYSVDFTKLVKHFREGIEIKNRKYHMKTFKNCFIGSEAVTWLVDNQWVPNRQEAVLLGNFLLKTYAQSTKSHPFLTNNSSGLICHVTKAHSFADKYLFYKFNVCTPISDIC